MLSVGSSGLRTRRVRAALSVLGITIGVAALVGILGLSQSGSADLLEELDALGTNLLTVEAADGFRSQQANLSPEAAAMISRIAPVYEVSAITKISGGVFLNDLIQDGKNVAPQLNDDADQYDLRESRAFLRTSALTDFPVKLIGSPVSSQ